jgi:cytochrome oxidase assembly protein ShyY1
MHHCKTEVPEQAQGGLTQTGNILIPALLAVLTLIACFAAIWQWQRSSYHESLVQSTIQKQQLVRSLNTDVNSSISRVTVNGRWLSNSTTFVTPRVIEGRMGAWVISILAYVDSSGESRFLAVHRGWAAQGQVNQAPRLMPLSLGPVALQGDLVSVLPKSYELKPFNPSELGLWANYDLASHASVLKLKLEPAILQVSPESRDPDSQQLRRVSSVQLVAALEQKAASNRGYAVQWLGLALVGLFGLAWMWRSRLK